MNPKTNLSRMACRGISQRKQLLLFSVLLSFFLTTSHGQQQLTSARLQYQLEVQAFQKHNFRFSAAVKVNAGSRFAGAFLRATVEKTDGSRGFNKSTSRIQEADWQVYTIEGTLDAGADTLSLWFYCYFEGSFWVDDFKFQVEADSGPWTDVPIPNQRFEQWADTTAIAGWSGNLFFNELYHFEPDIEDPFEGKRALKITSRPQSVENQTELSQNIRKLKFEKITREDGLPNGTTTIIFQDRHGFIWIGTKDGLARYDGYRFTVYRSVEGDSMSLSSNDISALNEDDQGKIWVGTTTGGINVFDPTTEQFERLELQKKEEESRSSYTITAIFRDAKGMMWIGTAGDGLFRFDPDSGVSKHFQGDRSRPTGMQGNYVTTIGEDMHGYLWLSILGVGFTKLDKEAESFKNYALNTESGSGIRNIMDFLSLPSGNFWLATVNGLFEFDPVAGVFTKKYYRKEIKASGRHPNYLSGIHQAKDGLLWITQQEGGLLRFDPQTEQLTYFPREDENRHGLEGEFLNHVFVDREGIVWVAGEVEIQRLNYFAHRFQLLPDSLIFPYREDGIFLSVIEDRYFNLWSDDANGLLKFDLRTGEKTYFAHAPEDKTTTSGRVAYNGFRIDQQDNFWILTDNGGLDRFVYETNAFERWGELEGAPRYIYHHLPGKDPVHWVFSNQGLYKMDIDRREFTPLSTQTPEGESKRLSFITASTMDARGLIWAFDNNSKLYKISPDSGIVEEIQPDPDGQPTFLNRGTTVSDMHVDSAGYLWLATQGRGLLRYHTEDGTYVRFLEKDGLPNNILGGIVPDDAGHFWIATEGGLTRFDPVGERFENYYDYDGLPTNQLNTMGFYRSPRTGIIYFTSIRGFVAFDPTALRSNPLTPELAFSSLRRVNPKENQGKPQIFNGLYTTPSLTLSHENDLIFIDFAAMSYANPKGNRYAYKMEGLNRDWIDLGARHEVSFTNLPPGQYTLHIRGSNADHVWNNAGKTLALTITPPWYWAGWSKTLYLLLGIGAIWSLYRWRTRAQRQELERAELVNTRLRQVDQLKDQFLANTSHELRTPLQGIIGISEALYDQESNPGKQENLELIISSGKRLNSLVNDILDFSKLKNYDIQLQLKPLNLRVLADIVLHNNAPMVSGKKLELINEIPDDLPPVLGDENRLQQVLYNLVGNAIKFTETGHIKIRAEEKEGQIQVSVEDTGIGIPAGQLDTVFRAFEQVDGSVSRNQTGTGLGLSISRRLVRLHGGKLGVRSQPGRGSTFFFTLPVSTEKAAAAIPRSAGRRAMGKPGVAPVVPASTMAGPWLATKDFRILIVDDETINQRVLLHHLAGQNFQVSQAWNGEEALKAIQSEPAPDLVLLDVMMPRMSGYEVCQKIREQWLPSELPVIMITAKNQLQDIVQGLSHGANDYLPKPFHKEELLARIRTQLDLHHIFDIAGRFVPNEFLLSLNRDRITEVVLGDRAEREVTVLFLDIRAYTTLAETMTPEENFKFVNAFFGRMGPIIRKHRGFINQYLGDAIMAIFPREPQWALQAAIAMQQCLTVYNEERSVRGRQPIRMGIGMHTGQLIMGIIGDQKRMDAATIADTVNTASRIEGLTKYYGVSILLSEDSWQLIPDQARYRIRYLGEVLVKGKKEPVKLFECFDGELPETIAKKSQTLQDFEQGVELFFDRSFAQALAAFDRVLRQNAEDQPTRLYMNKSSKLLINGVPDDWTGVEVFVHKY